MLSKKEYMTKAFATMQLVDGVIMFLIAILYGAAYFLNVANNTNNNLSTADKLLIMLFILIFFTASVLTFMSGRLARAEISKKEISKGTKVMIVVSGIISAIALVIFFLMGFLSTALVYIFFAANSFILFSRLKNKSE
ncbi:MAG: hypothetical protein IKQ71_10710 [Lachnospiraceae bacterium]|nr:hypothetical protein [Lachnospiraceae bacterium]